MTGPGPHQAEVMAALEATWPAAALRRQGPFTLRDGGGGGKRVSAATAEGPPDAAAIRAAEAAMRAAGQRPLFRLRPALCPWDAALDDVLAARGYEMLDPTLFMVAPVARLIASDLPALRQFPIWPPLEIQRQIWAEAGIGAGRQAIMARVAGPKTALLARIDDRPAGVAFVACSGAVAMLHAMETLPRLRRKGAARGLMHGAADWAAAQGAEWLALAVTRANAPARALYAAMGMAELGGYHHREAPESKETRS